MDAHKKTENSLNQKGQSKPISETEAEEPQNASTQFLSVGGDDQPISSLKLARMSLNQRVSVVRSMQQLQGNAFVQRLLHPAAKHDTPQPTATHNLKDNLAQVPNAPSSDTIQLQARGRWQPARATRRHIDALLAPNSQVWRQLNPDTQSSINCPATAAAVDEFLSTGRINPAPSASEFDTFEFRAAPQSDPTEDFDDIRNLVSRRNTFVVIQGIRPETGDLTPDHWFVLLNRGGTLHIVDRFGDGEITGDVNGYVQRQGFIRYRYYRGSFRVRHVHQEL